MRTILFTLLTLALASATAFAQVGGPVLGYVPDGGRVRTVYGIPATAAVGAALDQDRSYAQITISPRQDYALATDANSGEALLIRPGLQTAVLDGTAAGADRIIVSPRGSSVALWFSATSHLQIVKGLPLSPSVQDVDAGFLGTAPGALAVSDDGTWVAGVWPGGVYALGSSGAVNLLPVDSAAASTITAMSFFHLGTDLAIAAPSGVTTIRDIGGSAVPSLVYDSSANPLSPVGIGLSFDNRRVAMADQSGALLSVDLSSGLPQSFDCACTPEGLFGMGGSIFRLTGMRPGALRLFDAASGDLLSAPPAMIAGGQQ